MQRFVCIVDVTDLGRWQTMVGGEEDTFGIDENKDAPDHHDEGDHAGGQVVMLFLFVALLIGCASRFALEVYLVNLNCVVAGSFCESV